MPEKIDVVCSTAPDAIGPYSQAIKYGNMLFVSGQLPVNPRTGQIESPDIADQTRQSLTNLQAILEASGGGTASVVKTTVFLRSILDFDMMNEVYAEFFPFRPPARSTIEVSGLPRDAQVEIEAIAMLPKMEM